MQGAVQAHKAGVRVRVRVQMLCVGEQGRGWWVFAHRSRTVIDQMRDRRQVTARDGELAVLECNVCECTESTERPTYHGVGKVPGPRGPEHDDAAVQLGRGGNQTVALDSIVLL